MPSLDKTGRKSDMVQFTDLEGTTEPPRGLAWNPFRVSEARRAEFRKGWNAGPLGGVHPVTCI